MTGVIKWKKIKMEKKTEYKVRGGGSGGGGSGGKDNIIESHESKW